MVLGIFGVLISISAWRPVGTDLILAPLEDECECECQGCDFMDQHAFQCGAAYEGWDLRETTESKREHPCESISCGAHAHVECDPEEEDLDDLELALSHLDGPDLLRLLDQNPERLIWNVDRGSVQLWGCGEKIDLSVQMSTQQIAFLRDAESP
jgi:hypothetical protein